MTIYLPSTAWTAQEASVLTGTTGPTPPTGASSYFYNQTDGQSAYQRRNVDSTGAWRMRRAIYLSAATTVDVDMVLLRTGADAATTLVVRGNGAGQLRLSAPADATPFRYTSAAAIPAAGWYRLEAYGNAVNDTVRVALFNFTATSPLAGFDSGILAATYDTPTGIRVGKTGAATGYAGRVAWALDEFHTNTDAPQEFIGPYGSAALTLAGVITPGDPRTVGTQLTLTLTVTGSNGNPITYSGTWDGAAFGPQTSNTVVHTDATAGVKNWTATASQPA